MFYGGIIVAKGKTSKKKKIIIAVIVIVIIAIAAVIGISIFKNVNRKKAVASMMSGVQTTNLTKKDLSQSLSVTGSIASACSKQVTANVKDIEVVEVAVSIGDYVNEGDVILRFDSEDLEEQLEDAKADDEITSLKQQQQLDNAQDNVTNAQKTYEKGVTEQNEKVSDAYNDYKSAANDEYAAKKLYKDAQASTEMAKEAYEAIKNNEDAYREALTAAEAALNEANAAMSVAKNTYEQLDAELKYLAEDDPSYATKYAEYTAAYAAYQSAAAEAEAASAAKNAAQAQFDSIANAKSAYEQAKNNESSARGTYEKAQNATSKSLSSYNSAVSNAADTNEKNAKSVEVSKEDLTITSKEVAKNLKSSTEKVEAAVDSLNGCAVVSPISGYITSINVSEGDVYNGTDTLFVVQDMTSFIVEATVDEYDIASLEKGQTAIIKTDATGDEEFTGELTYVALTPDSTSGSSQMGSSSSSSSNYSIEITLKDTSEKLRVGMTAKTSIVLEQAESAFSVPYDCIEEDPQGSYITVLDGNSTENTKKIYVTVGLESDYYVEISGDGLEEGMKVVTPTTVSGTSTDGFDPSSFSGFGGMGGDMPSGMPSDGGMPSGGGMPGGF